MQTPIEVWNSVPVAAPPVPPSPAPAGLQAARPAISVTQPKTDLKGKVWVSHRSIHLGSEHVGNRVIALRDGDHVDLFTLDGTHIRSLDFAPGRNHYGSGRDRLQTIAMKRSPRQN